jgi:uncharacterized protein YutE (UPF0331/DUF86 family)
VPEVNLDRLRELAAELRRAIGQLRTLGKASEDEFLADAKTVNSAKYLFIVACEAAIDICNHLSARRGGRAPEDYADCFQVLQEMGVLEVQLGRRLVRMARFRNLLVHLYWKVDDTKVYRAIHENLGDFELYLDAIRQYLSSDLGPTS